MIILTLAFQAFWAFVLGGLYVWLKHYNNSPVLANILATFAVIFAFINIDGAKDMALIYIILGFLAIMLSHMLTTSKKSDKEVKTTSNFVNVLIGLGVLVFMFALQSTTKGLVLGVPLAVGSFGLLGVAAAALIENSVFFSLLSLFDDFIEKIWKFIEKLLYKIPFIEIFLPMFSPMLILVIPIVVFSYIFGVFPHSSYAGRTAAMIFAISIMAIWMIIYKKTGSSLGPDITHFGWNVTLGLTRAAGLVIGGISNV